MAFVLNISLITQPALAIDEQFYSSNDILYYNKDGECLPSSGAYTAASGNISVVQSNIKSNLSADDFKNTLATSLDRSPDFVSLNEVGSRSKDVMTTPEYDLYRDNAAEGQARGTAVLWKKDTWSKVDAGRILMVKNGPQEWDAGRSATWVMLEKSSGETASMISIHHMINPAKVGPDERKQIYKEGLENVIPKINELTALGPVFVAGDFNSQYDANDPWGPREVLGTAGLKATFDSKGAEPTHDGGGVIDYIFHSKDATVTDQWFKPTASDHKVVGAQFSLSGESTGGQSTTPVVSEVSSCVCSGTGASTQTSLSGSDNEEKAFNFFKSKGLSPQQSAGAVGNMKAESGVLPMRKQSTTAETKTSSKDVVNSGSGWGIVQWTPPSKMINPSIAAKKSFTEIDTLEYQLQFLWEQLEGTGIGQKANEKAAGDDLKKQTTISGSARSFMLKFERPKDKSESAQKGRVQLANEVFGKFGNGGGQTMPSTNTTSGCGDTAIASGDVVSVAQAELKKGVKENPVGCDSGNNSVKGSCGKEVDKYTDGTLEYWCADFVSWVYRQAGTPLTGGSSGGWRIPSVNNIRSWFKSKGTWIKNGPGVIPQPGDVYTMPISHTGIVEKVEGDTIYTISGNTSTDSTGNGNGVGRGSYKIGSSAIDGFGRLK